MKDGDCTPPIKWGRAGGATCWARRLGGSTPSCCSVAAGDVRQLGGDVLIDPQGVIRLHHVGRGPADRPAVARLLNVIDGRL